MVSDPWGVIQNLVASDQLTIEEPEDGWFCDWSWAADQNIKRVTARERLYTMHRENPAKHPRKKLLRQCGQKRIKVLYTKVY